MCVCNRGNGNLFHAILEDGILPFYFYLSLSVSDIFHMLQDFLVSILLSDDTIVSESHYHKGDSKANKIDFLIF